VIDDLIARGRAAAVMIALGLLASSSPLAADITGAGATFPYPVYAKWAEAYRQQSGVDVNYLPIGSGAGVDQVKRKMVDFGASDVPLAVEDLRESQLVQFPAIIGGVVPVVNIPGVRPGELRLTGEVLGDIYLGKIRRWNERPIADLNPSVKLPDANITVVHRSDRSGTSYLWTDYLSKTNAEWKSRIGTGMAVAWPTGVDGEGNEGVASYIQRTKVSIGYVQYAYARRNNLSHVSIRNREGEFVQPTSDTFRAAAATADWRHAPGFDRILTDQPGKRSWPIAGASFVLIPNSGNDPRHTLAVLRFFDWALTDGQQIARDLDYVPISDDDVKLITEAWTAQLRDATGRAIWQ